MEVHVSDLTWDQFIYPRGGKSEKTIDAYVETLAIGAQFPPIKIQRVFNYPSSPTFSNKGGKGGFSDQTTEATIILDGIHRWFAFKESGIKKVMLFLKIPIFILSFLFLTLLTFMLT